MQKYHDEPKQYKGYLKSALMAEEKVSLVSGTKRAKQGGYFWPCGS